ncbi:hypothetical protein B7P43_G10804 [Cryptotermes secundus]|uniref:Peptidase S1 domain-containing protein n=2 Tax=Cryptotermes secundus TaxID=105785 RepID=A0A2J7RRL3_9NEOP|nr:mucin-2 [Cryptotermes secundus]PNF43462.1 hypothetical protein B7P43_G10804 [Cryptotermes secundus]
MSCVPQGALLALLAAILHCTMTSPVWMPQFLSGGSGRNIRHLPCVSRRTGETGVCMFAFACMKANGTHLGTCIDRFYFGSCCQLQQENVSYVENTEDNNVLPVTTTTESKYYLSTFQSIQDSDNKVEDDDQPIAKPIKPVILPTKKPIVPEKKPTSSLTTVKLTMTEPTVTKENTTFTITTKESSTKPSVKPFTTDSVAAIQPSETTRKPAISTATSETSRRPVTEPTKPPKTTTPKPVTQTTIIQSTTRRPVTQIKPSGVTTRKPATQHTNPSGTSTKKPISLAETTTRKPIIQTSSSATIGKPATEQTTTRKPSTQDTTQRITVPLETTTRKFVTQTDSTTAKTGTQAAPIDYTTRKPTIQMTPHRTTTKKPVTQAKPPETPTRRPVTQTKPPDTITVSVPQAKPEATTRRPVTQTKPQGTITVSVPQAKPEATTRRPVTQTKPQGTITVSVPQAKPEATTRRPVTQTKPQGTITVSVPQAKPEATTRRPLPQTKPQTTETKPVIHTTSSVIPTRAPPVTQPRPPAVTTTKKPLPTTSRKPTKRPTIKTTESPVETTTTTTPAPPSLITWTMLQEPPGTEATTATTTSDGWIQIPVTTHPPSVDSTSNLGTSTSRFPDTPPDVTTAPPPIITTTPTTSTTTKLRPEITISTTFVPEVASEDALAANTTLDIDLNTTDFRQVCGRRLFPESRVVGGEKSSFGKWPWQISLRQWRTSTYLHKCGAALLNENWAITAAHCVENVPPSDLLLRLGEHDLSSEEEPYGYQERRVQIVASHPQFDARTFEYDLALLRFYEPVTFQPNILPICVPHDDTNFVGHTAYVTGWGRLYEDGPLPSVLQEVSVPVINNSVCETMYRSAGYIEHIPEIFICAGWKKGGFDSCEGDSGGPMVIQRPDKRWLLAGVISWGIGCAEPNQPGVYTRISEFREWINQILQF